MKTIIFAFFIILLSPVSASSQTCLVGCVKAEVKGLREIAGALNQWAQLLPRLNEEFHKEIRNDLLAMDSVASNLINQLDRTYGNNLDLTSETIKSLIRFSVDQINVIGNNAVNTYKKLLFETECTAEGAISNLASGISEVIPRFQWLRSWFGTKFNVVETVDFSRMTISEDFDPNSETDKFHASYRLLSKKLNSMRDDTPIQDVLGVALERQKKAYKYHCQTRASMGSIANHGHIFELLQQSRIEYNAINMIYSFGR